MKKPTGFWKARDYAKETETRERNKACLYLLVISLGMLVVSCLEAI